MTSSEVFLFCYNKRMSHLLHPELFEKMPYSGAAVADYLERDCEVAELSDTPGTSSPISVVIRTLNEAPQLESLITDLSRQRFGGEVEIIVVDNESTDHTAKVAKSVGAV